MIMNFLKRVPAGMMIEPNSAAGGIACISR